MWQLRTERARRGTQACAGRSSSGGIPLTMRKRSEKAPRRTTWTPIARSRFTGRRPPVRRLCGDRLIIDRWGVCRSFPIASAGARYRADHHVSRGARRRATRAADLRIVRVSLQPRAQAERAQRGPRTSGADRQTRPGRAASPTGPLANTESAFSRNPAEKVFCRLGHFLMNQGAQ